MSEKLLALCGNPESIGDWTEIEDLEEFEKACRSDAAVMDSALIYSCMAWTAHSYLAGQDDTPINPDYESSYKRIRDLAVEIKGEHAVKKIETGIYNAVVNP